MNNKKRVVLFLTVPILLIIVLFMDTLIAVGMISQQGRESGMYKLESISGKLEGTISDAENLTMELAIEAREYLDDKEALEKFIYEKKAEILEGNTGAFNIIIAGSDWGIFPDFNKPDDYIATERIWYKGGIENNGEVYVSPPYQDAMTGEICYTVSIMLADGDTVLGLDYTMDSIQEYITQMYKAGSSYALILTGDGVIAGCSDEKLIGEKQADVLPRYSGIYSLAKKNNGVATIRLKADFLYDNLFATKSGNGWYLIISQNDWDLYRESYMQVFLAFILSVLIFFTVSVFYLFTMRSQKNAKETLAIKEEFLKNMMAEIRQPLAKILQRSSKENIQNADDVYSEVAQIHIDSEKLSETIGQITSYFSLVRTEQMKKNQNSDNEHKVNKRFRTVIILCMLLVMGISLYTNISATSNWEYVSMQTDIDKYEKQLSEWINSQKNVLDMFCNVFATEPEILEDYEGTVNYLSKLTSQYPEIAAAYMTNPNLEHTVYMSTGWIPDEDWQVEERQWYIDTIASDKGWSISSPYYDEATGGYCVTMSQIVYDVVTGEFLGIFGIDFYMSQLIDILGDSYTDVGYAFLVDSEGNILNHPYGKYQMSQEQQVNIATLPYSKVEVDSETLKIIRDYNKVDRIIVATRNEESQLSVYVATNFWQVYGKVFRYMLSTSLTLLLCVFLVYRFLTEIIRKQDETNKKMEAAVDAAITAGKAKSQFFAQMSHDIRTPINAVLGMNEMIIHEATDEKIVGYAKNVQGASKTLLSIVNNILDFSKIEDGKMEIILVRYDVPSVINNLVNSISERAKAKSLDFIVDIDKNLPSTLLGDDVRISQVIMNLLTNAVKYTEKGQIVFSIQDAGRDAESINLRISVKDTGAGIKAEDRDKLFSLFERIEEKRNRNIEGTGLGMAIVTKLLAMMDSELQVNSVYGQGSEFSFILKQAIIDEEPIGDYVERLKNAAKKSEKEEILYAPQAKVLVVDDNEMNLLVAKNLLGLNGIEADLASSGEESIKMIKKKQYDIVFMDHMMPKMDGIETLAKLRAENLLAENTMVIALTANAIVGAKEMYLAAGFDSYISKPIEVDKFEEKLAKYLPNEKISYRKRVKQIVEEQETELVYPEEDEETINKAIGLSYCNGNESVYEELLQIYYKQGQEYLQKLAKFAEAKDWQNYAIVAHALKSTSLNIGARQFSALAKEHEMASKEEKNAWLDEHWSNFQVELAAVLEEVKQMIPQQEVENSVEKIFKEVTRDEYKEECATLIEFIRNYEMNAALEQVHYLSQLTTTTIDVELQSKLLGEVLAAIDDFDYIHAEELMDEWMKGV